MSNADDKFFHARVKQRRDFAADLWMIRVQPNGESSSHRAVRHYGRQAEREAFRSVRTHRLVPVRKRNRILFRNSSPTAKLRRTPQVAKWATRCGCRKVPKGRFTSHKVDAPITCWSRPSQASTLRQYIERFTGLERGPFAGEQKLFASMASRSWNADTSKSCEVLADESALATEFIPTGAVPGDDSEVRGEIGRVDDLIRKYLTCGVNGDNRSATSAAIFR